MSRKRVLVVDYEPKSLERLLALLPQDLYEVQTAKDGMAALEEFDAFHPDLVLLRTMLPKKHGFQVCQEMVERTGSKPVPVVMHCSIYKSRKYRTDAIKIYGAAEYLEDPVEAGVLQEILDRFLVQKKVEPSRPLLPPEPEPSETPTMKLPAPPLARPAPEPVAKAAPSRSGLDIDKALEDTLSGLHVGGAKKRPAAAPVPAPPKVEAPRPAPPPPPPPPPVVEAPKPAPPPPPPPPPPVETPRPAPPAPAPPVVEAPKPAHAPAAPESRMTSEELFGDVLREVAPAAVPPIPKPEPPKAAPAPAPAKAAPPVELGQDLLQPASGGDTGVKRMTQRSSKEMDRKLEETLSGVRLKPKASAPAPAKPVEVPKVELPKPEPPKRVAPPEPPEIELPKIEPPKRVAPPEPPVVELPKVEPPKVEAPKPEPPKPAPVLAPAPVAAEESARDKGVTFGQYLLMDKIAVGGMAELFKAKQTGLEGFQRIVAIKRILPHLAANAEFVTMFIDEAKLAAQLKHPNIVHIYDLGKLEDSYFIAMEYVDGRDLRAVLRELDEQGKTLPTRAVLFVAHQVAAALQCAHAAKDVDGRAMHLVHRDVSPQNVLISSTGEVKLVDFGIAKAASKASHTQTGALKGKLLYMSPEQAYGRPTDPRTDIFSLAVVMFEMLTGRKLFYGDSEMSILEKVREAKIPDLGEFSDRIPSGLQRILRRALEKDLERRYPDAKAFQMDLEKFARQEWKALPGPYHALAFLTDIFPDVYKKETVKALAHDESKLEDTGVHEIPKAAEPEPRPDTKPPKSMRGKPAPLPPKKVEPEPKPEPRPEPKPAERAPEPKPVEKAPPPKPKAEPRPAAAEAPAPKPVPPPPKKAEESAGMFGGVMEDQSPKSKTGLFIGVGVAAALLVIVAIVWAVSGGKKPATPATPEPPKPGTTAPGGTPTEPTPKPTPPPVLTPVEPAQPAPGAAPVSEADLKASRDAATRAVKSFDDAIVAAEQAGAPQYAKDALASIKKSKENIDRLFRRAKTKEEYDAVSQTSAQALTLAQQVKQQAVDGKAAEDRIKAAETAAAEEAKRKADEEARRKAEEAAAAATPAPAGTKAGDFVELFAVSVKPKEIQSLRVEYTAQARQYRLQGTVYLEVDIDERGAVTSARAVKAPKPDYGMGEALIRAALLMKYTPAIKDGVPVKTRMTFPVRLEMQ